jgi:hypothetical protein
MLCSPQALAEGFDSPRAEVCCLLRSAAHVGGFLQMCGRVLRPYGERQLQDAIALGQKLGIDLHPSAFVLKERALLIDGSDATSIHGPPTADRVYSLDGKGIALEKLEDEDAEESEDRAAPEFAKVVEMKFTLVRDKLRDMLVTLCETAKEKEYRMGWVFHRFTEKTGIQPPRVFEAKFQSTCKHCRHKVKLNEQILWGGTGLVYHVDCWFETLEQKQLLSADEMQPKAQRILADLPLPPAAPQRGLSEDFIPF